MKKIIIPFVLILWSCGGQLSKEERAKLHEGMATQDIRRVTDAELQEAAIALGTAIMRDVERVDKYLLKKNAIDSLAAARGVVIYSLQPDAATLKDIEHQLVEAYMEGANTGMARDNLQSIGTDSLLFTRPLFRLHPDGSQEFTHAVGIRMAKRTVIFSMPQP